MVGIFKSDFSLNPLFNGEIDLIFYLVFIFVKFTRHIF